MEHIPVNSLEIQFALELQKTWLFLEIAGRGEIHIKKKKKVNISV